MKRIIYILTIICFWQGLFAQITSVGELFGGRESGKLPHREVSAFAVYLSPDVLSDTYPINRGHFYLKAFFFVDFPFNLVLLVEFIHTSAL